MINALALVATLNAGTTKWLIDDLSLVA